MDEKDFEGTLVLEKLAEIGKLDSFFEAIDSDDFDKPKPMKKGVPNIQWMLLIV